MKLKYAIQILAVIIAIFLVMPLAFAKDLSTNVKPSINESSTVTLFYKSEIASLDKKNPENVMKAIGAFRSCFSSTEKHLADQGYVIFRNFYDDVLESQTDLLIKEEGCFGKDVTNKIEIAKQHVYTDLIRQSPLLRNDECLGRLYKNGMDLFLSEGDVYVDERPGFLLLAFAPFVSANVLDFLKIRDRELQQGFQDDSRLGISFRDVSRRVWEWEDYQRKHPHSLLNKESDFYQKLYLSVFLVGLANSPAFDFETKRIEEKTISLYKDYIKKHPKTKTSRILENYLNLLQSSSYSWNDSIPAFLEENGLEDLRQVQLPER